MRVQVCGFIKCSSSRCSGLCIVQLHRFHLACCFSNITDPSDCPCVQMLQMFRLFVFLIFRFHSLPDVLDVCWLTVCPICSMPMLSWFPDFQFFDILKVPVFHCLFVRRFDFQFSYVTDIWLCRLSRYSCLGCFQILFSSVFSDIPSFQHFCLQLLSFLKWSDVCSFQCLFFSDVENFQGLLTCFKSLHFRSVWF